MKRPSTFAVRTPHQAERLGSSGAAARPLAKIAQEIALATGVRAAGRAEVWVATRLALEELGELPGPEATAERRAATVSAFDAAVGWLRRTGASSSAWAASELDRVARVARVADAVARRLQAAGLCDSRALAALAAQSTEGAAGPLGDVAVVGVVPGELETLLAIEATHRAARARGGTARLVLPRPREGGEDEGAFADWIERRWGAQSDPPDLEWLTPAAAPAEVERIEAPTPHAEAREAAAAIARGVAGGLAPERIAVVVARLDDAVVRSLVVALADAGLPSSREGSASVLEAPEVAIALDLLAMADGRLTRDGLADVLRAPGLHAGSWVGAAHEAEASRLAAQIAHRLREVPVAVDRSGGARLVEALAAKDAWASVAVARATASIRALGAARGRVAIAAAWSELITRLRLGRPSASEIGAALRGEGASATATARTAGARLDAIATGARGVAVLLEAAQALADAERRLGSERAPLMPGDVLAEVRELSRGASAAPGGGAPRAGAIRIATARDLAGLEHDLLVVTGLGASAYGAAEVRGLIDEEALRALPAACRPPPLAVRRAARAAELGWAIAGARRLVLTRRAGLAGGHDEAPHPIFATAAGTILSAADDDAASPPRRAPASPLLPGASLAAPRDAALARLAGGDRSAAPPAALAARAAEEERARYFLDPRAAAGSFSGRIAHRALADLAARVGGDSVDRPIPVTDVERAARCGFAAFATRVLRIRRVEDAVEAATARERGILVHGALQVAFEAMRDAPPSTSHAALRVLAEAAALAQARADQATPLRREAVLAAVREALTIVDLDLESGDASSFRMAERRFGAGQPAPWGPLRLDPVPGEDAPPIWVEGRIDRIDAAGDGRWVRVVDYKTGKLPKKKDELVRSLQLALYAEAARRFGGDDPARPVQVAARYVEVRRGAARAKDVAVDADAVETARNNTRKVVLRLWSGDAGPRAFDARLCRRCDARDVCRKPAVATSEDDDGGAEESGS